MRMSGQEIRVLRQRLGWSLAEMARQMGCGVDLIQRWEDGSSLPESDALNQLQYLSDYVDSNSECISQTPVAEVTMEEKGLSQMTYRDLLNNKFMQD